MIKTRQYAKILHIVWFFSFRKSKNYFGLLGITLHAGVKRGSFIVLKALSGVSLQNNFF